MTREVREALERLRPALGGSTEALWAGYLAADMNGRRELESQLKFIHRRESEPVLEMVRGAA